MEKIPGNKEWNRNETRFVIIIDWIIRNTENKEILLIWNYLASWKTHNLQSALGHSTENTCRKNN